MFVGDESRLCVNRGGVYGKPFEELKENPLPENAWRGRPSGNQTGNFFECVAAQAQRALRRHRVGPRDVRKLPKKTPGKRLTPRSQHGLMGGDTDPQRL